MSKKETIDYKKAILSVSFMKNKLLTLVKKLPFKLAVLFAFLSFFLGPFLQDRTTSFLEAKFPEEDIIILGCNPIQNSLMVVTSSNGDEKKIHSANSAPFVMDTNFALVNNSQSIHKDARVYLGFFNEADNSLVSANFLSNNRTDLDNISVEEKDDGSFILNIGDIYPDDVIIGTVSTMYPTATLIDVRTDSANSRSMLNPGDCSEKLFELKISEPQQFYQNIDFEEPSNTPVFKVDDIIAPIGPIIFERVFYYNCGEGLKESVVQAIPSKGESITICGHTYSNSAL